MSLAALGLVLAAAVLHATWNLMSKRAGTAGPAFVWLVAGCSTAIYLPVAFVSFWLTRPAIGPAELAFMGGSGVLHAGYFLLLQRGYSTGDLSVVYPLARGTGPLLATAFAIAVIGERPGPVAIGGAVLVCAGVVALGLRGRGDPSAIGFGLATGVVIAVYTLWDRHAVAVLAIPPLVLDWGANAGRTMLLTPLAARRRIRVREVWTAHRREVLGTALLSPLAYILVLTALTFTPVSYVAPAREASILIGAMLGARLLAEGDIVRRAAAAAAIVAGVVALAIG